MYKRTETGDTKCNRRFLGHKFRKEDKRVRPWLARDGRICYRIRIVSLCEFCTYAVTTEFDIWPSSPHLEEPQLKGWLAPDFTLHGAIKNDYWEPSDNERLGWADEIGFDQLLRRTLDNARPALYNQIFRESPATRYLRSLSDKPARRRRKARKAPAKRRRVRK